MNNMYRFKEIAKANQYVIHQWRTIANQAITSRGVFTVALSGGFSPIPLYQALAEEKDLPWSLTELFLVDERFVPQADPKSNYRMIKEQLFGRLSLFNQQIHAIPICKTPLESAVEYASELRENFNPKPNTFPSFDLILLGLGEDGHTASLFTAHDCSEKQKLVMHTISPKAPHDRITLTLPVLNHAKHIIFFIRGENKTQIVDRVFQEKTLDYPASQIKRTNKKISVIFVNE